MEMAIYELLGEIQEVAKQTIQGTLDRLMVWRKFGSFWKSDKVAVIISSNGLLIFTFNLIKLLIIFLLRIII